MHFKSDGLHNFMSSYGSKHFIVKYHMLHIFQIAPENHANIVWYSKISAGLPLLSVNQITKICGEKQVLSGDCGTTCLTREGREKGKE